MRVKNFLKFNKRHSLLENTAISEQLNLKQESLTFSIFIMDVLTSLMCLLMKQREFIVDFPETDGERLIYLYLIMLASLVSAIICGFKYLFKVKFCRMTGVIFKDESFSNHPLFKEFMLEITLLLIHPSPFLKDYCFSTTNQDL